DDKGLLFSLHRTGEGSADTLSVLPAGATELRRLITPEGGDDLSTPCYAPSGHILYRRSGSNPGIWALPFSLDELVATGEAFLVAPNGYRPSVSNDGTLLHSESAVNANFQLVLADRQGRTDQPIGEPLEGQAFLPGMSADGRRATLSTTSDEATNVWAFDLASGARTRLLLQQKGFAVAPLWMPSGTHVIGARGNFPDVEFFRLATDGSGTVEVLGEGLFPLDVTPDGSTLLMGRPGGQASYFILSLDETGEPTPFLDGPGDKEGASLSPDGRYVAYSSDESGHSEVYVTRFPSGEGKWLVYEKEAADPIWSPAGDEIFFMSDGDFRAAPVSTEGGVSIGPSEVLFALSGTGLELARG
ncbi:MAG: TolB family protein, partial [Planctomycetota bacterium]